jgi:competence ComEA-like helix-hairpin-helix protein
MLNLTKQERQVILFLITVGLFGMGVNFLMKKYTPLKSVLCFEHDFGKVNLNKAGKQALVELPGIGEKLAQRIIDYRIKSGSFGDVNELRNIKGMNLNRYEKLKGLIIVE